MDKLDIERQVLTTGPFFFSSHYGDDEFNLHWAQATNDFLAGVCREYPNRFSGFVTVPLLNVKHAIDELKRAMNAHGMVGVVLASNIGGQMLDSPEFMPFYEEVNKRKLTILIHPNLPIGFDKITEYQQLFDLYGFIGFLFDTTMAVARMAYKGIFERYNNIILIAPHLGGMLPYVYPSIDIMWERRTRNRMEASPKPPSEYFKRFYTDTARPLNAATLQCAIALFGEDHILFGSDIPRVMDLDAPGRIISTIEGIGLTAQTEEKIFHTNAKRLFKL
jgi:aminocarboxymuconate-semialdehyde decarboxylase